MSSEVKICLAVPDDGACSYYRAAMPYKHCASVLASEGVRLDFRQMKEVDLGVNYDAFHFYRIMAPDFTPVLIRLKSQGKKIYWDIDDHMLAIPEHSTAYKSFTPLDMESYTLGLMVADGISTSTRPLADALGYPAKTRVCPNLLDLGSWPPAHPKAYDPACPKLLWAGSPTHNKDLEVVVPALRRFREMFPSGYIIFYSHIPDYIRKDDGIRAFFLAPTAMRDYHSTLRVVNPDLSFCPLSTDEKDLVFNVCKSAIKYFEMTMAGAVVAATRCQPFSDVVQDNYDGYLCWSQDDWVHAVEDFATKYALSKGRSPLMLNRAYEKVKNEYTFNHNVAGKAAWLEHFRRIAEDVRASRGNA